MSLGKRELILARLFTIGSAAFEAGVTGDKLVTKVRNRGFLDQDMRPAFALLDGNEEATLTGEGRGRVKMSPAKIRMLPQMFFVLKNKVVKNEDIGPTLNTLRGKLIAAVATDAELVTLVGSNGDIAYIGCETDLNTGQTMQGEMQLNFAITTILNPYDN